VRPVLATPIASFLAVGLLGTAAYLTAYLLLRGVAPAQEANLVARITIALATTWLNARYTFRSAASLPRVCVTATAALAAGLTISASALAAEQALAGPNHRLVEAATLTVTTVVATVARFLLLRRGLSPRHPVGLRELGATLRTIVTHRTTHPAGS
jgi:putative flippase GtrA